MTLGEVFPCIRNAGLFEGALLRGQGYEFIYSHPHPVNRCDERILQFLRARGNHKALVSGFAVSMTEYEANICCPGHGRQTITTVRVVPPDPRQLHFPFVSRVVVPFRRRL